MSPDCLVSYRHGYNGVMPIPSYRPTTEVIWKHRSPRRLRAAVFLSLLSLFTASGVNSRLLAEDKKGVPSLHPAESTAPESASSPAAPDTPATPQPQAALVEGLTLNFRDDIEPILREHCHRCHGAELQRGGLRLDLREEAAKGGHSGQPILGGTLDTNELYRRVNSHDRTYWMPKGAERLAESEIALLARWIEEGTPWPETKNVPPPVTPNPAERTWSQFFLQTLDAYDSQFQAMARYIDHFRAYAVWFFAALLLIAVIERSRLAAEKEHPWSTGSFRRWFALCRRIRLTPSRLLLLLGAFLTFIYVEIAQETHRTLQDQIERLSAERDELNRKLEHRYKPTEVYGNPPVPIRPNHPTRLQGTYYRGNCERNPQLFNGGHYLTARIHVALCDAEQQPLNVGDPVPKDGFTIRFEIERAPNATESLFTESMMHSVFLSPQVYEAGAADVKDEPHHLETWEAKSRWGVFYRIAEIPTEETRSLEGLVYVYVGRAERHYGIKYDLKFADGRIAEGSDVWVGSLFWHSNLALPQRDKIPLDEWFDYRPIPEITGPNSSDPKLLGIDDHIRPEDTKKASPP